LQVRPNVDEQELLFRSLKDERDLVLRPRLARLEAALKQVLELADGHDDPEETLIAIGEIAEAALQL
jgi:hypothetical protein